MARTTNLVATCSFVLALLAGSSLAQATILTFNIDNTNGTPFAGGNMKTVHPDYGDNVNSLTQTPAGKIYNYSQGNAFTPNITLGYDYDPSTVDIRFYNDGDGVSGNPPKWRDVAFLVGGVAPAATRKFWFTFTPNDSLYSVKVNSFDLFRYTSNENQNATWTLFADTVGGAVLDSGVTGPFNTTIDAPLTINTAGVNYFGTVILEIQHTLGSGGGFALDNLNFDQIEFVPAPEPSSLLLLGLGSCFLSMKRRRSAQQAA